MDILWDLYQQRQINTAEQSANDANRKATDVQFRLHELEESLDKLVLINTAMWELIKNRIGLTEMQRLTILDNPFGSAVSSGVIPSGAVMRR